MAFTCFTWSTWAAGASGVAAAGGTSLAGLGWRPCAACTLFATSRLLRLVSRLLRLLSMLPRVLSMLARALSRLPRLLPSPRWRLDLLEPPPLIAAPLPQVPPLLLRICPALLQGGVPGRVHRQVNTIDSLLLTHKLWEAARHPSNQPHRMSPYCLRLYQHTHTSQAHTRHVHEHIHQEVTWWRHPRPVN